MPYLFTSESVSEGHPDKVADQISDALIDNFLAFDPQSKVACETLVTTGQVVLAGGQVIVQTGPRFWEVSLQQLIHSMVVERMMSHPTKPCLDKCMIMTFHVQKKKHASAGISPNICVSQTMRSLPVMSKNTLILATMKIQTSRMMTPPISQKVNY